MKKVDHIKDFIAPPMVLSSLFVLSSRRKEPIWQQVEAVTSDFSADQIINALVTNTRLSSLVTKDMTARVDIRRDAQKLRYALSQENLSSLFRVFDQIRHKPDCTATKDG